MLWAVLQFALPAVASGVDARLEHESRFQVAHIESTSSTSCRPVHSAECALCQLLTQHASTAAAPDAPTIASCVPSGVFSECLAPATASLEHLPPARAPPLA